MKPLEELTPEELIALAKEKQEALEAKELELAAKLKELQDKDADLLNAKQTVDKLKKQVTEKKDLAGPKTRVKIGGDVYEFPSEKLTMPNHTLGGDIETIDAKEAALNPTLLAELKERGVLIKVK